MSVHFSWKPRGKREEVTWDIASHVTVNEVSVSPPSIQTFIHSFAHFTISPILSISHVHRPPWFLHNLIAHDLVEAVNGRLEPVRLIDRVQLLHRKAEGAFDDVNAESLFTEDCLDRPQLGGDIDRLCWKSR